MLPSDGELILYALSVNACSPMVMQANIMLAIVSMPISLLRKYLGVFDGHGSSLEEDSSNEAKEEKMQDTNIEEFIGWLFKLLIMVDEERRARKRHRAVALGAST